MVSNNYDPSVPAEKNHSIIHYKNTGFPLVLRIEKIKVNSDPIVIEKLAIGKSGGIDCEADRYETQTKVYCHKCDKYIDKTIPKVANMVDSIMMAQSAFE